MNYVRALGLYTGATFAYGLFRAHRRYQRPDTVLAIALCAPFLWPVSGALDVCEHHIGVGEGCCMMAVRGRDPDGPYI